MDDLKTRAQSGIRRVEEAIVEILKRNPKGLTNFELAKYLDLESGQDGRQKNYLSWSILGRLMAREAVIRTKSDGKRVLYKVKT